MAATVLIVDDHPGFRSFARALLEAEGFDVVGEAVDGVSGVALAQDSAGEVSRRAVPVPAGTPIAVERGDDADRRVIGDCVVARFTGTDGRRYSLAVTPPRRASLEALLR